MSAKTVINGEPDLVSIDATNAIFINYPAIPDDYSTLTNIAFTLKESVKDDDTRFLQKFWRGPTGATAPTIDFDLDTVNHIVSVRLTEADYALIDKTKNFTFRINLAFEVTGFGWITVRELDTFKLIVKPQWTNL